MRSQTPKAGDPDRLDAAVSRRLAGLRTVPVDDLAGIRAAIVAEVGPPQPVGRQGAGRQLRWFSPMRLAAASVLLCGLVAAAVIATASGPALASADRLAELHAEVQGHDGSHAHRVDSISGANTALAGMAGGAPPLPDVPADQVHFCCVQRMGRKPVSCAAMVVAGRPVTLAVADAREIRVRDEDRRVVDGREYFVQSRNGLSMVMTISGGRWVCVMGELPIDRLLDLAKGVRP